FLRVVHLLSVYYLLLGCSSLLLFFLLFIKSHSPTSTLFPYTTLFRSNLFQEKDIPLHGTDEKGTIIVTTDGKDYEMDTKQMTKSKQSTTKKPKQEKKKQQATENTATGNCVDINSASFDEVQKIIHIGEARAELLIEARPYTSVDDLTRINGIGPARIDDIKAEGIACVK